MEEKRIQVKQYLTATVNPLLKPMVEAIVAARPTHIMKFILQYAQQHPSISNEEGSEHSEGETMTKEEEEALIKKKNARKKKVDGGKKNSRKGISAEVFGEYNKKADFKPRVHRKSEQSFSFIKKLLLKSFMFQALSQQNLKIVIEGMQVKTCTTGEKVITEGDAGDMLYVVGEGQFDCTKVINGNSTYLKTYKSGDLFGQLSLMYNTKRAASINCPRKGLLFALDRQTFTHIVQESAIKRRHQWKTIIDQIDILKDVEAGEKELLCDALKEECFQGGSYVVKEGEDGDRLYFVMEGSLVAEKMNPRSGKSQQVMKYGEREYFGEISLLKNSVRQASIKTTSKCKLLSVGRAEFKRLLGPIENILQRNIENYKKFMSK